MASPKEKHNDRMLFLCFPTSSIGATAEEANHIGATAEEANQGHRGLFWNPKHKVARRKLDLCFSRDSPTQVISLGDSQKPTQARFNIITYHNPIYKDPCNGNSAIGLTSTKGVTSTLLRPRTASRSISCRTASGNGSDWPDISCFPCSACRFGCGTALEALEQGVQGLSQE